VEDLELIILRQSTASPIQASHCNLRTPIAWVFAYRQIGKIRQEICPEQDPNPIQLKDHTGLANEPETARWIGTGATNKRL
jgi:hypothetical protein